MSNESSEALIYTNHSTHFSVKNKNNFLHGTRSNGPKMSKIHLYFCEGTPFALLVSDLKTSFSLSPKGPKSHTHIVKICDHKNDNYTILDLWSRKFLAARPPVESHGVFETRDIVSDWELFRSEGRVALPSSLNRLIEMLTKETITADDMLNIISSETGEPAQRLISALLPTMSLFESDVLGRRLLENHTVCENLQEIFTDDIWVKKALPSLYALNAEGNTSASTERRRTVDPSFDILSTAGKQGVTEGAGYALNALARRAVQPSKLSCVVATARNEGIYLLEWVAYHRALGVDEIIIYSNNNSDSSDLILSALAEAGEIIWYNNEIDPKCDAQSKAYSHALTVLPETLAYEWCAFIDIDEFICINPEIFESLPDFLHWHGIRDVDNIAVNWVYFGSSGQAKWGQKPITERLTARHEKADAHVKSIFKPRNSISSQPHFPRASERYSLLFKSSDGDLHTSFKSTLPPEIAKAQSDRPQATHAFIAHYFYKTCEEFLWKFSRNRGDYEMSEDDITLALEARFLKGFLKQYKNAARNQTITSDNPDFDATYERLLQNPQIGDAASKVKSAFRERSARVLDMYRPVLMDDFGDDGRAFLAILDQT